MACWPPGMPVWAIAEPPATASSKFLGLAPDRTAARPNAAGGPVLSIVAIHLGICGCSSPCGRPRNCRSATSSSRTPRAILTQLTQVAGDPDLLAPPAPARDKTMAPTMPRPISQPRTKTGPLTLALRLVSMSTTAMIGIGLSAIPTASGSDPPMALPITPPGAGGADGVVPGAAVLRRQATPLVLHYPRVFNSHLTRRGWSRHRRDRSGCAVDECLTRGRPARPSKEEA